MDSAHKLEPGSWNPEGPTRPVLTEAPAATSSARGSRTLYVLLGLQIVALAAVATSAFVTRDLVIGVRGSTTEQSEVMTKQVEALSAQSQELQKEITNVRQLVSSRIGADVIFLKIMVLHPSVDPDLGRRIARSVHHYATLYRRDPDLVLAIMDVESKFNPKAVSSVGAEGLMQVMPHWKKVLAIQGDLSDVDTSIQYGMQVLGFYLEMYKDLEHALTAYNRGPGPVDNALVKGNSPNNGYAPKVLQVYERLRSLNASPETL